MQYLDLQCRKSTRPRATLICQREGDIESLQRVAAGCREAGAHRSLNWWASTLTGLERHLGFCRAGARISSSSFPLSLPQTASPSSINHANRALRSGHVHPSQAMADQDP